MKTKILLVFAVLAVARSNSVGQGYFLFGATKNTVWDAFTTGTTISGGHTRVGFLWGPAATDPWPPPGTPPGPLGWDVILNNPVFHFATNFTANTLAAVNVNASGLAVGGINYNGGTMFQVAGTTGGAIYTLVVVGWDSDYADPWSAGSVSAALGWSNPFQYAAGNGPTSTPLLFTSSGLQSFAVVPEPATGMLAGLGVAALMCLRRIRSEPLRTTLVPLSRHW